MKTPDRLHQAVQHLQSRDPVMRELIGQIGPFTLRAERDRFGLLVRAIISQQISTGAARAIRQRLYDLVAPQKLTPGALLELEEVALRQAGLSPQKVLYLRDLARHCHEGSLQPHQLGRLSDEKVIEQLVQVKGIGRWTAQMFLIFGLLRLDVFPSEDLGVRMAIRNLYGLADLPDRKTSIAVAARWRPYASVASWYCWRSIDRKRTTRTSASGYPS